MYARIHSLAAAAIATAIAATAASAVVTPPAGYIYTTELLSNLTQGCVAAGPGGTFVGIGPSFTANAEAVVLAKESGELHLVAMGFNSISDCAYDRATDTLYVTDNATNADLGITTMFGNTGAQTGDTVYAVPSASSAAGRNASDLELLPAGSVPFAANVTLDPSGNLLVANAVGGGSGTVLKISCGRRISLDPALYSGNTSLSACNSKNTPKTAVSSAETTTSTSWTRMARGAASKVRRVRTRACWR